MANLLGFCGSLFVQCCFNSYIKRARQVTMCSLDSQISPASKNRAPIHHESAKSGQVSLLSLPIVMGVGCVFRGKIFGKLSVLGNLAACAQVSRRLRVVGSTRTFNIRSSHWLIPNTAHAQSGDNLRLERAMSFRQNIDIRSSKLCAQLTVDLYEGRSSQLYTHLLRLRKEILKNIFGGHAKAR